MTDQPLDEAAFDRHAAEVLQLLNHVLPDGCAFMVILTLPCGEADGDTPIRLRSRGLCPNHMEAVLDHMAETARKGGVRPLDRVAKAGRA